MILLWMDGGEERFFHHSDKNYFEYYYRHFDKDLFAWSASSLEECQSEKEKWIDNKNERRKKFLLNLKKSRLAKLAKSGGLT